MPYVKIEGLPRVRFAHVYGCDAYENRLPREAEHCMEIAYVSEGKLLTRPVGGQWLTAEKYDLTCNVCQTETELYSPKFHEHHTVAFWVEYAETAGNGMLFLPRVLSLEGYGKPHELIDEIIYIKTMEPENHLKMAGLFLQLLAEYDRLARHAEVNPHGGENSYVFKAKEYIYENLHRSVTQREIAEYLKITPQYLCTIFKKACGITPVRFINTVKLSGVRAAMVREKLKLREAAELYGYSDPNYVSRLFKKYYGYNLTGSRSDTMGWRLLDE